MIAAVEVYSTVSCTVFSDLLCTFVYFIFSLKLLGRWRRWPLPLIPLPNLPLKRLSTLSLKRDPGILALVSWDVKYLIVWNSWLTNWVGCWAAELRPQAKMLPGWLRFRFKLFRSFWFQDLSGCMWLYHFLIERLGIMFTANSKHQIVPHDQVFPHSTSRAFLFASSVLGHLKMIRELSNIFVEHVPHVARKQLQTQT